MHKACEEKQKLSRRCFLYSTAASIVYSCFVPRAVKAALPSKAKVLSVRFGKRGNGTRCVMELSDNLDFKVFTLIDPYRVVVDFYNSETFAKPGDIHEGKGHVSSLRFGASQGNKSRLVFDLKEPVFVKKSFILKPQSGFGWRFVLDFESTGRDEFIKNIGNAGAFSVVPGKKPTLDKKGKIVSAKDSETKKIAVTPDKTAKTVDAPVIPKKKPEPPKKRTIVLDPGHGGRDPGAVGVGNVYEKHITLAMAKELKAELEATGHYKVILTRYRDKAVSLRSRRVKARKAKADLFLSLHADSSKKRKVRGLSVYTLSERASDKEAAALAARENKADVIAGIDFSHESPEVTDILIDLVRRETMNLSAEFASFMVKEMVKAVQLLRNTHRFAGFAVLKAPDVPSVLLEMGYVSNPKEVKLLQTRWYRSKLAKATVKAVNNYFSTAVNVV